MSSRFLVALFVATFTSISAYTGDRSFDSRGPYLVIQSGNVSIHKIYVNGQTEVQRYDSSKGASAFQKIENEVASASVEKGSFKTSDNKAIIDWVSMKDGYTYGTMFGPPGEELFVMHTSRFKNKRDSIDYEAFKKLCDQVSFIPAAGR